MREGYFVQRLESLRGIAAMMVACSHALLLFRLSGFQGFIARGLGVVCSGWAGVTLFFVLSGYVLGLAIRRVESDASVGIIRYIIRRVFRIYPVFLFSTLLLLSWLYLGATLLPAISQWLGEPYLGYHPSVLNHHTQPTLSVLIRNLLMLDSSLNLVTWTLKVEMIWSLLLPGLHYIVRRFGTAAKLLVLLGLIWIACLGKSLLLVGFPEAEAFFDATVLKYLFLFYLGYVLPEVGPFFTRKIKDNVVSSGLLCALGTALFFGASLLAFGSFRDDLRIVQGLGAALIIAVILYGAPLKSLGFLDHPVITFYGRISYSFYLWHDLVLIAVFRLFIFSTPAGVWGNYPLIWAGSLWLASTVLATGVAWLSFRGIEKPFIELAKRICLRLVPSQVTFPISAQAGPKQSVVT